MYGWNMTKMKVLSRKKLFLFQDGKDASMLAKERQYGELVSLFQKVRFARSNFNIWGHVTINCTPCIHC